MTDSTTSCEGGCLCEGVRYRVVGALRPVSFCHCDQCSKTSGHYVAATACRHEHLEIVSDATLTWYRSSPKAQRGFCNRCGGNLFWWPDEGHEMSIMAGTLDRPTGLTGENHIFLSSKSDYYDVNDGLPQFAEYD